MSAIICKNPIGKISGGLPGSKEADLDDTPTDGQVVTFNASKGKYDAQTPPGAGGGEANEMSNIGTAGVGIYKQKTGIEFEMKKINASSNKVTITDDTGDDEVDIDVVPSNIKLDSLGIPDDTTTRDATGSLHGLMPKADKSKIDGIESGATADQSDSEIETAYGNQVSAASQAEMEAGSETAIRRMSPLRVKQAIDALGGGGGASSVLTVVEKQSDQTVNNSTTLVNDTALLFALLANHRYYFVLRIRFESNSAPDIKVGFTAPSGAVGNHRRDLDNNTELDIWLDWCVDRLNWKSKTGI